ncbi:hypothetical protein KKF91_20905 [Myxococcota bacterium]|nr:hypothetical protein [Myxococcota bacterium]MBU1433006.1 hypothetical protein [Myxococcota bacterium]MBU1898664.1 hypothetical protein [Myxococcota bacterium]
MTPTFVGLHLFGLHAIFLYFDAPPPSPMLAQQATLRIDSGGEVERGDQIQAPKPAAPPTPPLTRPGQLDFQGRVLVEDHLEAPVDQGWTARLSLDPWLQRYAEGLLSRRDKIPFGAVVVIDVRSGEVLALAEQYDPNRRVTPPITSKSAPHVALRAVAPAASVFKLITTTGLLERGVRPQQTHAYNKAVRRVYSKDLDQLGANALRASLTDGVADSNNGLMARLADEHLDGQDLQLLSARFGFNQVLPFPMLAEASVAHVPRGRLERARMAAGFWHTQLTPLHGALIAAAIAGDGQLPTPRLVTALRDPQGRWIGAPREPPIARAMKPEIAAEIRGMMAETVRRGTAHKAFKKWPKALRHIQVAGKTGTLARGKIGATSDEPPYTSYTWFVGFAPADNPQIAFAVMIGNGELWYWKAVHVAEEVLSAYFRRQLKAG